MRAGGMLLEGQQPEAAVTGFAHHELAAYPRQVMPATHAPLQDCLGTLKHWARQVLVIRSVGQLAGGVGASCHAPPYGRQPQVADVSTEQSAAPCAPAPDQLPEGLDYPGEVDMPRRQGR